MPSTAQGFSVYIRTSSIGSRPDPVLDRAPGTLPAGRATGEPGDSPLNHPILGDWTILSCTMRTVEVIIARVVLGVSVGQCCLPRRGPRTALMYGIF